MKDLGIATITLKVEGEILDFEIIGFTAKSLKLRNGYSVFYLTRQNFNIASQHPEMNWHHQIIVTPNGMQYTFLV